MYIRYLNIPDSILLKDIHSLWEQNDILIFLVEMDKYTYNIGFLDESEKEDLDKLQTGYFRERYVVSRTILKFVLRDLLEGESVFEISTYKDKYGRVHVRDHGELHICISYTGNIISFAISKVNVGIDLELKRPFSAGKFSKCMIKQAVGTHCFKDDFSMLALFTLKEAYSKYYNESILFCFNKELDTNNVFSSSYILDEKYILSIIADAKHPAVNIGYLQKIEFDFSF